MAGKKTKESQKTWRLFRLTLLLMPVIVVIGVAFTYFQMTRMERGVLDVCAVQQDAYVELVLDQINLKENREDEEIIDRILGSLDASANKYWTFSEDQTMLFVKDVLETNRYKGLSTDTYYMSESARDFINSLSANRVTHGVITVDDREYVASGVEFNYDGRDFRLCLLTNQAVFLDNNSFLGAKTELWLVILVTLWLLLTVSTYLATKMWGIEKQRKTLDEMLQRMRENLVKMNDRLANQDLHDTRENLWKQKALPEFIDKLQARGVAPVSLVQVHCPDAAGRQKFLTLSKALLDHHVLRFEGEGNDLELLFIGTDPDAAYLSVAPILSADIYVTGIRTVSAAGIQV